MANAEDKDESSAKSVWDFVLAVLRDRKLRWIGIPLLLVAGFIYVKYILLRPGPDHDTTSNVPTPSCKQWNLAGRLVNQDNQYLTIKGVKIGIEAGPYSNDDQITDGKFFIPRVTLSNDQLIHLFLECQSTKHFFYESQLSYIVIDTNMSTCTLTFHNDLTVSPDVVNSLCPPPPHTFSINLSDQEIRSYVQSHSRFKYDPASPKNRIVVTFDPHQFEEAAGHPPRLLFHQSNPIATMNGETFTLGNCVIPDCPYPTDNRQFVENWAREQVAQRATAYLKHNPSLIVQWLNQSGQ